LNARAFGLVYVAKPFPSAREWVTACLKRCAFGRSDDGIE